MAQLPPRCCCQLDASMGKARRRPEREKKESAPTPAATTDTEENDELEGGFLGYLKRRFFSLLRILGTMMILHYFHEPIVRVFKSLTEDPE